MSTIPEIDQTRLGCVASEIALRKAGEGDKDALMANTILAVADAARADIVALEEGGGGGGGGGTNSTFTVGAWNDCPTHAVEFAAQITTLAGSSADGSSLVADINGVARGLFVMEVAFDAGYGGAAVRLSGYDRWGVEQIEDITANAGSTVRGSKVWSRLTNVATLTPGGAGDKLARFAFRRVAVVAHTPVATFVAAYRVAAIDNALLTIATEDKTNGWVAISGGTLPAQDDSVRVQHTWTHTHTIS